MKATALNKLTQLKKLHLARSNSVGTKHQSHLHASNINIMALHTDSGLSDRRTSDILGANRKSQFFSNIRSDIKTFKIPDAIPVGEGDAIAIMDIGVADTTSEIRDFEAGDNLELAGSVSDNDFDDIDNESRSVVSASEPADS